MDDLQPDGLRLTAAEREFLPRLGPLLPTPRSAKRLVNLYRLLRIGIPHDDVAAFVGSDDGGPYQAAALLLAAVLGHTGTIRTLLSELWQANPGGDIVEHLRSHGSGQLADLIDTIRKDIPVHGDVASYQRWGRAVARYSFETYDLFLDS